MLNLSFLSFQHEPDTAEGSNLRERRVNFTGTTHNA